MEQVLQVQLSPIAGTWSTIAGATLSTYDAGAVGVTTNYRRITISTLNNVVCSTASNCLTVTPNIVDAGAIAGDQTLCTPFDPAAFTSTTAGSGGTGAVITYRWESNTTGCGATTWTAIGGATLATYDAGAVAVTTYFRRITISTLNNVVCSTASNCLTVTPNPVTGGA